MKRTLAIAIVFVLLTACASAPTATPTAMPSSTATSLPTSTALPTATSTPTLTPTPTSTPTPTLPPIVATAWASDASGKVNPQMMYPLVGAINYKHHKAIDADYVLLRLAIVTDQDLIKLDANAQKNLRTSTVARFNQNNELRRWILNIRLELIRLYPTQPPFKIIIENDKPTQVIAETDGTLVRYVPDASGKLTKLDRYNLLPPLYVDGKDIKRKDTGEVVQLKGMQIPSFLEAPWAKDNRYFIGLVQVAKQWGADHVQLFFRARRVQPYMAEAKQTIEEAERQGMYVVITGGGLGSEGSNQGYNDIPLLNDEVIDALVILARELKPYNNVILDIWNEPAGSFLRPTNALDNFERETYEVYVKAIKAIRAANDQVIIAVTGVGWGSDFTFLNLLPPLPDSNLIYRVQHMSPTPAGSAITVIPDSDWDLVLGRWRFLIGVHPVLIGEFGQGGNTADKKADPSKWWERTLNELVNKYNLSYSQYVLGIYSSNYITDLANRTDFNVPCNRFTCFFTYTRTPRGDVVYNDLQKFPPMQFDK